MQFTPVSRGFLTICIVAITVAPSMAQDWSWFGRSKQSTPQAQSQYAQPSRTQNQVPTQAQYQGNQSYNSAAYNYNYGTYPVQQQAASAYAPQSYPQQSQPATRTSNKKKSSSGTMKSSDNSRWYTNWDDAWGQARRQGRPLVVVVVHHGCPVCDQLDATLSNPAAMATLDSAVKARLEFSDNAEFLHRTGVKLTPTFLVFSPASNGEVYREVGALTLQRLQALKPSIDSLVSEPVTEKNTKPRKSADADTAIDEGNETPTASI